MKVPSKCLHLLGIDYKAKVLPRATPAMAMTVVRNGSCSVKIDVAAPLLDVGEEALVPVPVPVLEAAAEDEAGSESKSTEEVGKKNGKRYILPHSWFLS